MQCRACGTDNPLQANYCVECGEPLSNVSRLAGGADRGPERTSSDLPDERVLLEMMRRQRERDRRLMRLTLGIAVTALFLAVVAGAGAWWPRLTRQAAGPPATRSMAEDAPSSSTVTSSERPGTNSERAATSSERAATRSERAQATRVPAPTVTVREEKPVPPSDPPPTGRESAASETTVRQAPARPETPTREPPGRRSAGVNVRDRAARSTSDDAAVAGRRAPSAELPAVTSRRDAAREAPAALPGPAGALNDVDVRVRPRGNDGAGEIREYVVTLKDAQGAPYANADVALRGETSRGDIVEVTLEPGAPGVYAAAVRVRPDGPRNLKVRITRDGATSVIAVPQSGS